MSLSSPLWLLALAAIPLLALLQLLAARRRRRHAVRFPALGLLAAVAPRGSAAWRRWLPAVLVLAALAGSHRRQAALPRGGRSRCRSRRRR